MWLIASHARLLQTSCAMQIPRPRAFLRYSSHNRNRYNIIIEPWVTNANHKQCHEAAGKYFTSRQPLDSLEYSLNQQKQQVRKGRTIKNRRASIWPYPPSKGAARDLRVGNGVGMRDGPDSKDWRAGRFSLPQNVATMADCPIFVPRNGLSVFVRPCVPRSVAKRPCDGLRRCPYGHPSGNATRSTPSSMLCHHQ